MLVRPFIFVFFIFNVDGVADNYDFISLCLFKFSVLFNPSKWTLNKEFPHIISSL